MWPGTDRRLRVPAQVHPLRHQPVRGRNPASICVESLVRPHEEARLPTIGPSVVPAHVLDRGAGQVSAHAQGQLRQRVYGRLHARVPEQVLNDAPVLVVLRMRGRGLRQLFHAWIWTLDSSRDPVPQSHGVIRHRSLVCNLKGSQSWLP